MTESVLLEPPYLLFLGDAPDPLAVKTAEGIHHWRPDFVVGQMRLPGCKADLGLPDLVPETAAEAGAKTLVIGVANRGGILPDHWCPALMTALDSGLDLASGLHQRLTSREGLVRKAAALGRRLIDVRHPQGPFPIANGRPRAGRRLLTVGTDCAIGKKFTALALEAALTQQGRPATFRATGQTGIMIAGAGIPMDAVVADFVAGAAETLSPENQPEHWDLIEGQGSLFHPSFAGVSLGLLHGSQPDAMVLCHQPGRPHLRGLPHFPLPALTAAIHLHETMARMVNPAARVIAMALDTHLISDEAAARAACAAVSAETGLPASDPVRFGVAPILEAMDHVPPKAV